MPHLLRAIFFDIGDTLVTANGNSFRLLPGVKTLLADLHTLSVPLGIISNTADLTRQQLREKLPPDLDWSVFDPNLIVLSSEVHAEKPEPAIYINAVAKAAVDPASCLYCSEDLLETLAAERVGMRVARLQKPPQSDASELLRDLVRSKLLDGPS